MLIVKIRKPGNGCDPGFVRWIVPYHSADSAAIWPGYRLDRMPSGPDLFPPAGARAVPLR